MKAISISATVLITVLTGLLFLPHSLSVSLVISAWVAVLTTYATVRWITYPILPRWPALMHWVSWKTSASDWLDAGYFWLQKNLKKIPQWALSAMVALIVFALSRPYPSFTLSTPVNSLSLLPQHSALYLALKKQLLPWHPVVRMPWLSSLPRHFIL
ncbi:hypothetical protein [Sulfobacillus thermosulfidooxidans]|uniref:hypothetical protein n=1 Tax=Sulfobacillus thermosulfidooxidans TaxID=28034 RepID=UPI001494C34F|nr:hypothetical protein [Sulfobacillus thermosulfidooxidans]